MEIRDPIHGSISILKEEIPILTHKFFQRLRNIKQLGLSEFIFPGATHTRFLHSIGVMRVGDRVFDFLFKEKLHLTDYQRLKETFKLACLLHDVGHAPLSHTTESVMPSLFDLKIPHQFLDDQDKVKNRRATHEDYTIKALADSSFGESFAAIERSFGPIRTHIADLIRGVTQDESFFTIDGLNYFPLLHQLVSSELDCDRMDYLLRDSYFCGVSYGKFDLDWLITNLEICPIEGKAFLGVAEKAVITFDDFLLSRYHMFVMVYFHYRAVCLEQLLLKFFNSSNEYKIPPSIEKYVDHDDHYLMSHLRNSENAFAKRIVKNQIPHKIFESFNFEQQQTLNKLLEYLEQEKIDFIHSSSTGRLSKYHQNQGAKSFPLMVVRDRGPYKEPKYQEIQNSTDLFDKFTEGHEINRLHVDLENLSTQQRTHIFDIVQ